MPQCYVQAFEIAQDYQAVYEHQQQLVAMRSVDEIPDTLLLGEHPPVMTLGRGSRRQTAETHGGISPNAIPVIVTERGGDITYHGPGQLVGYPIFALAPAERNLHTYLRRLESVIIDTLAAWDIEGARKPGWTGVWVGDQKIASIGVAVKRWVTFHGFALNVTTDLSAYATIRPCGLPPTVMTSMALEASDKPVSVATVLPVLLQAMGHVFQREMILPEGAPSLRHL